MEREKCLEELKKNYEKVKSRYNLPGFEKLNEEFSVEEVAEKETDFLAREIRRQMMDKVSAYLRLIETILNPTNAPFFIFALIKNFNSDDKKVLEKVYFSLAEFEVGSIELDNIYSEEKEAEFIKTLLSSWNEIKKEMGEILEGLKKGLKSSMEKKNRGYLG